MTSQTQSQSVSVVAGLSELADRYDVVLCDVWGVLHDGRKAFPAAVDALRRFRAAGGTVVLLTNAPRPAGPVVEQLGRLGVPQDAYDAIVTSGDATIGLLAARGLDSVYHIGPHRDLALFDELCRTTGLVPPLVGLDAATLVVCTGLVDDVRETPENYRPTLEAMRVRRLDMICANPDIVVHIADRISYCGGALAERYESMGGTVFYAGKPHAPIYREAMERSISLRGGSSPLSRVLAIGDGLRTDVAGAVRHGIDCLFVAGGIHRDEALSAATGRIDPHSIQRLYSGLTRRPVAAVDRLGW